MNEYILSIDCGTQSIRALIFDTEGNLIAKESMEFKRPYYSDYPGWAEQDANVYWNGLCNVCKNIKEKNNNIFENVAGVTITTMRDTVVNVDKNGDPLRPVILWLDQRMAKCEEPIPLFYNLIYTLIGMKSAVEISRRKSKANWIKENEKEIWEKTYRYLMLSGYLNFMLTGEMIDSVACQIGHIPFDYKNFSWPKSFLNYRWSMFGVEEDKLPSLVQPGSIIGYVTEKASKESGIKKGLPVIASASDKGCETLGCGCLDLSSASISFGTTATVQITSKKYIEPIPFMPSYPAAVPYCYNAEIQIYRGYWMISWFKNEFGAEDILEAKKKGIDVEELLSNKLDKIPAGSLGLMLQPFWSPGLKMPEAKGAMIGFGDVHTRLHVYRAIIEGINYGLLDGIEKIERKSKKKIDRIVVSGGGSKSDTICQITADMMGRNVYKGQTYEMSGLGAAINGFVGLKIYASYEEAVKNMVHYVKCFKPNKENHKLYNKLFNRVYKRIYPNLRKSYFEIQRITGYPNIY